jgi:opacity protein-like surface antigen
MISKNLGSDFFIVTTKPTFLIRKYEMKKNILLAAVIAATPLASQAVDFSAKGFASVIGGVTTDKSEFRPHVKYGGGKYDESFALDAESRVGIQVRADITDKLSATAQVVSRGGYNWRPELTWAYLGYEVNDNVQLKLGRLRVPFYLYSDYQDVGYALPWISPPRNAYMVPVDAVEGLNILTSFNTGKFDHVIEVWAGHMDDAQNKHEQGQLDTEIDGFGISYTPTYDDWLTLRFSYHEGDLDLYSDDLNALNGALAGLYAIPGNPVGIDPQMIANTTSKEVRSDFFGVAVKADFDKLTIIGEMNVLEWPTSVFPRQKRAYISAIYRATDKFTPYITLMKNDDNVGNIQLTGDPGLNGLLEGGFAASDTRAWAIGARYDLMPNVALKAEYQSQSSDITYNFEDVADTVRVAVDVLF